MNRAGKGKVPVVKKSALAKRAAAETETEAENETAGTLSKDAPIVYWEPGDSDGPDINDADGTARFREIRKGRLGRQPKRARFETEEISAPKYNAMQRAQDDAAIQTLSASPLDRPSFSIPSTSVYKATVEGKEVQVPAFAIDLVDATMLGNGKGVPTTIRPQAPAGIQRLHNSLWNPQSLTELEWQHLVAKLQAEIRRNRAIISIAAKVMGARGLQDVESQEQLSEVIGDIEAQHEGIEPGEDEGVEAGEDDGTEPVVDYYAVLGHGSNQDGCSQNVSDQGDSEDNNASESEMDSGEESEED